MNYDNQSFKDQSVELTGNRFHGCTFERCKLVYRGDISPTFHDNRFIDSVFVFADSAMRTLYFLSNIYHAGPGGAEVVEDTFQRIRQRTIHGLAATTITPHTADHSLEHRADM